MGRKAGITQLQERITVAVELDAVQRLHLHFDNIGTVRIGNMNSTTARRVFDALLAMIAPQLRKTLEEDTELDLSDRDTWFYVLNEIARTGVKLPIAERNV